MSTRAGRIKRREAGKTAPFFWFSGQIAESFFLSPAWAPGTPRGDVSSRVSRCLWQVHQQGSAWHPGAPLPKPCCSQIKEFFSMPIWTLHLFLDRVMSENGAQKKSTVVSQCVPVLTLLTETSSCPFLAGFSQCFPLCCFPKDKFLFFFSTPLTYLTLSFSPFTSIFLSSQQHSSLWFLPRQSPARAIFSLKEMSLTLGNCYRVFLFMNWHLLLRKCFTVKCPPGYRYSSPLGFVLKL